MSTVPDASADDLRALFEQGKRTLEKLDRRIAEWKTPQRGVTWNPHLVPAYRVLYWFDYGAERALRDEVIVPAAGFWEGRFHRSPDPERMPQWWVDRKFVQPLTEETYVWPCPCGRLWATVEAYAEHGCSEAPGVTPGQEATLVRMEPAAEPEPYVPRRRAEREKWRARWRHIQVTFHREGPNYKTLCKHLDAFPSLKCKPKTVAKIVRAGLAGLLD
jgi:hypothetical protein